jgi:hypothetical protein
MSGSIELGKIVKSDSHVRYLCQIHGIGEVAEPPHPADHAFGTFVRVPLRASEHEADVATLLPDELATSDALRPLATARQWAIGVIYDTLLLNPAFGTLGPRLSNAPQVELFSPDYVAERAVLVAILLLGTMTATEGPAPAFRSNGQAMGPRVPLVRHGVPPVAPELGAVVATLPEPDLRSFHFFADNGTPGGAQPYLHLGYLPHIVAQDHPLLPMVVLELIERLERLFPANEALLSIVKRKLAWRLKVQTAG